jgi:hypothetical protein
MLQGLDKFLSNKHKPTDVESVWYFFLDKGIGYNEFKELPIPYIMSMLKCAEYEHKQMKKQNRKVK